MSRFKGKPVGGLPSALPAEEAMLWQGAPDWRGLLRHAFRARLVAGYFALLIVWRVGAGLWNGHGLSFALGSGVSGVVLAASVLATFATLSWLISRTTTYSITSRRLVITYGMALPKSVNLPFSRIEAADLRVNADGTGDLVLRLPAKVRLSYLLLWPHVNAGENGRARPVLRCVPAPREVAAILAAAIGPTLAAPARAAVVPAAPVSGGLAAAHAA